MKGFFNLSESQIWIDLLTEWKTVKQDVENWCIGKFFSRGEFKFFEISAYFLNFLLPYFLTASLPRRYLLAVLDQMVFSFSLNNENLKYFDYWLYFLTSHFLSRFEWAIYESSKWPWKRTNLTFQFWGFNIFFSKLLL